MSFKTTDGAGSHQRRPLPRFVVAQFNARRVRAFVARSFQGVALANDWAPSLRGERDMGSTPERIADAWTP